MADLKAIADQLVSLTVKEVNELAAILKEEHGIEPAAAAVAMAAPGGAAAGPAAVEQTEFNVILKSSGAEKLKVVKEVKTLLNLGLKEAKELVEAAPKELKASAPKAEAEDIKKKVEEAGGKVTLKGL